jgi:hypothetical protein
MFAGIRHDVNFVFRIEHMEPTCEDILEGCKSLVADALKLGHGAALTNPDLPFLKWRYQNGYRQECVRDNPAVFEQATMRLFSQFVHYLGGADATSVLPQDREVITNTIRGNTSTDSDTRHQLWIKLLSDGAFSFGRLSEQEIAELGYEAKGSGSWKNAALKTIKEQDSADDIFPYDPAFETSNWKRFHDALKDHQRDVLTVILPRYALPSTFTASAFST